MRSMPHDARSQLLNRDRFMVRVAQRLRAFGLSVEEILRLPPRIRAGALEPLALALREAAQEVEWLGSGIVGAPSRVRTDLVALLLSTVEAWNVRCGQNVVRFASRFDKVVGRWDRLQLRVLLGELLSNACKHGALQPVLVTLSHADAGSVRIWVDDRGDDLPPRRPYRRFVRGRTAKGDGNGVGLWLADEVCRAHGGSIRFARLRGEGTRAIVKLTRA
jgi:signal transduction histidine kinase